MREALADLCHRQWSDWMRYLFSKCERNNDGTMTIPKWAVDRWEDQVKTDYKDLTHEEQETDKKEADKFLELLGGHHDIQ